MIKKTMFNLAVLLVAALPAMAQEPDTIKTVSPDTTIVNNKVTKEVAHEGAADAIAKQDFVLQTEWMTVTKSQRETRVEPTVNFLTVKDGKGLLQITPPAPEQDGYAATQSSVVKLDLLDYATEVDKKGNLICTFTANIDGCTRDFKVKLNKKNNKAEAYYDGGRLKFSGKLMPTSVADIQIAEMQS